MTSLAVPFHEWLNQDPANSYNWRNLARSKKPTYQVAAVAMRSLAWTTCPSTGIASLEDFAREVRRYSKGNFVGRHMSKLWRMNRQLILFEKPEDALIYNLRFGGQ